MLSLLTGEPADRSQKKSGRILLAPTDGNTTSGSAEAHGHSSGCDYS